VSPFDFVADLLNPDLAFLPKALAVAVMSAVVCGVVGCHVVLRGMAFVGDAVAHAVFPGLAIAFVVSGNLVLGGAIAGVVTAILVAVFSQNRRLREDSVIGIFFVAAFALGIVVISGAPGYAGSLQQFLFGSITGIPASDLWVVGITGLAVLTVVFALHKEFVVIALDRESALALGLRVFWFDLVLYVLVTLAVVISVQTIGNILVLALLVTPAATARLLTDRLGMMMLLGPAIGALSALLGLYISWSWDLPTGGVVVLVLTAAFLMAWLFAPQQGLVARSWRAHARAPASDAASGTMARPAAWGAAAGSAASAAARPTRPATTAPAIPTPAATSGKPVLGRASGTWAPAAIPAPAATRGSPTPAGVSGTRNPAQASAPKRWPLIATAVGLAVLGLAALTGAVLTAAVFSQPSAARPGDAGLARPNGDGGRGAESMGTSTAPGRGATGLIVPTPKSGTAGQASASTRSAASAAPESLENQAADEAWVARIAATSGVPERALTAYADAALAAALAEPGCGLGWNTLAAIGEVESAHGTVGGAGLGADGLVAPTIIGVALDGRDGTVRTPDTDHGVLDGDSIWDHAVGPMQFTPAVWAGHGQDGDGDGVADVNDLDDAASTAAAYLCDMGGDLTVPANWIAAVAAYNPDVDYNNRVAQAAERYAGLG
jgi:manganese/iron transport system permease protein